jgi:hypothetical protein
LFRLLNEARLSSIASAMVTSNLFSPGFWFFLIWSVQAVFAVLAIFFDLCVFVYNCLRVILDYILRLKI